VFSFSLAQAEHDGMVKECQESVKIENNNDDKEGSY
jgi:hypothetical protein